MEDRTFQDLVYQLRTIKLTENQTNDLKLVVAVKQSKDLATKRDRNPELTIVIEDILAKHREEDMAEFLQSRQWLNNVNGWLIYLFYPFQLAGILMTSYSVAHGSTTLVWGGVILNSLASIMQIYIKMHDASLKQMMLDLQLIEEGIQSEPPTVPALRDPKDAAMANRRVTEYEKSFMLYDNMTSKAEDGDLKALKATLGIIDKHKNDLEVELIRQLNTVEGKYVRMESELDAICLKIKSIRSELDSLAQTRPRAVSASTPSLPPYSYPYTMQRDYSSSNGS
jgi:hypothetical protein